MLVLRRTLTLVVLSLLCACSRTPMQDRLEAPVTAPIPPREELRVHPKSAPLIVLDPGHGGHDHGANCLVPRYPEKRAALQLAHLLQRQLAGLGYRVALTRTQDVFLPLHERARAANHQGASAFVSLHFNHCNNAQAKGIEVFYYAHDPVQARDLMSKRLARDILKGSVEITQARERGVKEASFVVIRHTQMPSVLVEGGFLSNADEGRAIGDLRYLEKLAHGIALGVHRYFINPAEATPALPTRSVEAMPARARLSTSANVPKPPPALKVKSSKPSPVRVRAS